MGRCEIKCCNCPCMLKFIRKIIKQEITPSPSPTNNIKGLQVQFANAHKQSIDFDETVLFNNIISNNSDITYDTSTGLFSINKAGTYLVNWDIACYGQSGTQMIFALETSDGKIIKTCGDNSTYGLSTSDVLVVTQPITFSIKCLGRYVLLIDSEVQANLTIIGY